MIWNKSEIYDALDESAGPLLDPQIKAFRQGVRPVWINEQIKQLRQRALQYLDFPLPACSYSLFRLYWDTGDRSSYQEPYFERRSRLFVFSILLWLEPNTPLWKTALEDTMWAICEEPFWCLPAHFFDVNGNSLPFSLYNSQLDLFCCETAFALSEALALCRSHLESKVVLRTESQIETRVFTPFTQCPMFRFERMANNWSGVCASAIGGAALHLIQDARAYGLALSVSFFIGFISFKLRYGRYLCRGYRILDLWLWIFHLLWRSSLLRTQKS